MLALDPANGSIVWPYAISTAHGTSPVVGPDGAIYVATNSSYSAGGDLYAFNPNRTLRWLWNAGSNGGGFETLAPAVSPLNGDILARNILGSTTG